MAGEVVIPDDLKPLAGRYESAPASTEGGGIKIPDDIAGLAGKYGKPPEEPPKPGLMKRIGQGLSDLVSTSPKAPEPRPVGERRGGPETPPYVAPGEVIPSTEPAEASTGAQPGLRRRGGLRSEVSTPFVAGEEALANRDRAAFAATDPRRVDWKPGPGQSVLDRPATLDTGLAEHEQQQGSMSPQGLADLQAQAKIRAPAEAKPFDTGQNLAQDLREATKNPVARGAVAGFTELGKVGTGALRLAADLTGNQELAQFAKGSGGIAETIGKGATSDLKGNDKLVADITSSIVNSSAPLVAGLLGGPAMTTLFAQSTLNEYAAGRDAGFDTGQSLARASIMGLAETLGERFGFPEQIQLLKSVTKKLPSGEVAKVFGSMLAKEIPGEQLTTAMQFLADKLGPAALKPNATIDDYLEAAGETLKVTIGQTLVMGGGPAALSAGREQYAKADAATARSAMTMPQRAMADAGFNVAGFEQFLAPQGAQPRPPTEARAETIKRFDEAAAAFGLVEKAAAKIREAAASMPTADVPGFIARAVKAFSARGLFKRPVDDAGLAELQAAVDGKPAEAAATPTEAPATPAGVTEPTAAPEGDYSGLADTTPGPAAPAATSAADNQQGGSDGDQAQEATQEGLLNVEGEKINRKWSAFSPESGTLGIPREQMPQIAAEHRGALVNFMNARGVGHSMEVVDPATLKPTQGEFEPKKVAAIAEKPSGRSLLVSKDGHILDGHHQWLAARESGNPIRVVRLDAPINDLLRLAHQFPSSTTAKGPTTRPANEPTPATGSDLANPAAAPAAAADAGGDQPGRGEAAAGPVPAQPADGVPGSVAPAAGPEQAGPAAAAPSATDQALKRLEDLRKQRTAAREAGDIEEAKRLNEQVVQARKDLDAAKAQDKAEAAVPESKPATPATSRVIGKYGRTPKVAVDIELRPNEDGTLTPYTGKYAMYEFDSGEPINLPADITDAQAAEAIRKAGAIGQKDRFYGVKADEATTAEGQEQQPAADAETAAAPAPAAPPGPTPEEAAAARTKRMDGLKALLHCLQT